MSNIVLSKEGFGLKLYDRLPPRYREDDVDQRLALRRYMDALGEGGFSYSIEEWNGILDFADPDQATPQALPLLFEQFGLNVFHGIPEAFLRYLLPRLGTAWQKKGGLDVIEFVASALSGIRTETAVRSQENGDVDVDVRLVMDYALSDYVPNPKQMARILSNFLPFYLGMSIIYTWVYHDQSDLHGVDDPFRDKVIYTTNEKGLIVPDEDEYLRDNTSVKYNERGHIGGKYALWSPKTPGLILPPGVEITGGTNLHGLNVDLYLNKGYIEVDHHTDVTRFVPVHDLITTHGEDSRKDHLVLGPHFLPALNTGLTLNFSLYTNADDCERGNFHTDLYAVDTFSLSPVSETVSLTSTKSLDYYQKSLNKDPLNGVLETNEHLDTDSHEDTLTVTSKETAEVSVDDEHLDHLTTGVVTYSPTLNTGYLTLNSGLITNLSNTEDRGVHVEEDEGHVSMQNTIKEVALLSPIIPALGMMTNSLAGGLNTNVLKVPECFDQVVYRDGTREVIFT